ncbi:MAG: EAL domain-containing protein [Rhodospirillales bacterium]
MPGAEIVADEDSIVCGLALTSERLTDAAVITTADPAPRIVFANSAFVRLTGHPASALRQRSLGFLQHQAAFQAELSLLHRQIAETGSFFMEVNLRRRDGKTLIVEWQATPVIAERGPGRYLFSIVRDVSHHRRRRALVHEREKTKVALSAVGDAVVCVDIAGRIEEMNQAAESLAGSSAAGARGQAASDVFRIVDASTGDAAADTAAACIVTGEIVVAPGRLLLSARDGRRTPVRVRAAPLRAQAGGVRGAVLVLREDPHAHQAGTRSGAGDRDRLTGLIGRREFERRLDTASSSARQYGRSQVLVYIDVDHFKQVNEAVGRVGGDAVLRQVANLLRARFRERDTLARLGGDTFGLLLDNCSLEEAERIAETIVASFAASRFTVPGSDAITVTPSIGLVEVTSSSGTAQQLLSQADLACYTAKELGRGRSHIYRSDTQTGETSPIVLFPQEFRTALEQDRFQLYYQPIVPLQQGGGLPVHYEFLLRHRTDSGHLVLPSTLIAAAERHGLMAAVDRWVIRAALAHLAGHRTRFGRGTIAINLSGNSLDDPGVVDYVIEQLAANDIDATMVCFEITESEAIRDLAHAANVARGLKELGCAIALDDFGSGQSSFTYLKALPADYLKIDGSFVREVTESPVDRSIVTAINATGRIMGLKTIAEFAHSEAIIDCLRDLGVDYAQGDAVAPPRPVPPLDGKAEPAPARREPRALPGAGPAAPA